MQLEIGYVYHIKNDFFDLVKDKNLMKNHENNNSRPNYFCIKKENNILWFIPMSLNIEKYKNIRDMKIKKNGQCDTIVIGKYKSKEQAFLLQNMFPITENYIDHIDTVRNTAIPVVEGLKQKLLHKANKLLILRGKGINLIFPDVDKIKQILLNESKDI
ncbi:MAG: hypothetical protein IKF83_01075 [Clostridia bacterium]|nr:hypothetical protein [Clostridia bacterium]